MNTEIIKSRVRAISRELKKSEIHCLIITKSANVTYVTGFLGEDSWTLIINGRSFLVTDSRYTEQAQNECPVCTIIERHEPMANAIANVIKKYKSVEKISVENSTSIAEFGLIKKALKTKVNTVGGVIEKIRMSKDESEITATKKAAAIATKALANTLPNIKPGMTESEVAGMLDFEIRKLGSTNSFETIVAFGPNASIAHHQPTLRKLKKNDTILIDFGAKYKGYCSDITRCFIIGKPDTFYQRVYDVVEKAQQAAIRNVKAGITIKELDSIARDIINLSDLPVYGHGTGHGLGIEIHESPFLNPQAKGPLQVGQIITIEPGVYIPNVLGIRIEDDCLVTKTSCEILTRRCPHKPLLQ
ncbi:MAG: aminopeptidase P family protein [Sedimentisphaerales bacterium]|nr:aminopeptidase P family protein [Sedimentisphaerales bacterium]